MIMKIPKISIIIPVYNAEKYLSRCLDSVLTQSFTDFEVVCVNDGSTDRSLEILVEYRKHDDRIRVINQHNKVTIFAVGNTNKPIGDCP